MVRHVTRDQQSADPAAFMRKSSEECSPRRAPEQLSKYVNSRKSSKFTVAFQIACSVLQNIIAIE